VFDVWSPTARSAFFSLPLDYAQHRSISAVQVTNPKTIEALTQVLSDEYSRKIMMATVPRAMSVEDISKENDIPLSTCYRRVHDLLEGGVLIVERIVVTQEGKKFELLRSAYRNMKIDFEGGQLAIEATVNEDVADKLYKMWLAMRT
jgi:hypothetical protein